MWSKSTPGVAALPASFGIRAQKATLSLERSVMSANSQNAGRGLAAEASAGPRGEEMIARASVGGDVGLKFGLTIVGRLGGDLGDVRRADEEVLSEAFHRSRQSG